MFEMGRKGAGCYMGVATSISDIFLVPRIKVNGGLEKVRKGEGCGDSGKVS